MEQLRYQIGITLIKGVGTILAKNLISYLGSAEAVFKETPANLSKIPSIGSVLASQIAQQKDVLARADREIEFIIKNNIQHYFYADKNYPYRLKECIDAPVMLYYKGNGSLSSGRMLGVVGTRNASEYGKELCLSVINELAELSPQLTIVSGLAYGIDICAHKTALACKLPTIAALGHGLDRLYPATHRTTAVKMLENGGLLTEYVTGTNPDRQNFLQRNRIIAGLCDAIWVVESASKGGSLVTAEWAGQYNRDVFSCPGRVGDIHSSGCNWLIKSNKAALIESASDIMNAMNWDVADSTDKLPIQACLFVDLNDDEQAVISTLRQNNGLQLNQIALALSMPVSKTSALLLEMEFKGILKCLPGNLYKLKN